MSELSKEDESDGDDVTLPTPKSGKGIFVLGVIGTVAWIALVVAWWWNRTDDIAGLEPNEFGDFLAGTFAPVAFLWLVLGFWQQGHELRNSANALWLQMRELQNSVAQQRDLVTATKDLRKAEREIHDERIAEDARVGRPIFRIGAGGGSTAGGQSNRYQYRFVISNAGADCSDVELWRDETRSTRIGALARGEQKTFTLLAPIDEREVTEVQVRCIDSRGSPFIEDWWIRTERSNHDAGRVIAGEADLTG